MNGVAVTDQWLKHLAEQRVGAARASNAAIAAAAASNDAATRWLAQVLPECVDEKTGRAHHAFLGAVSTLRYACGEGNVRRDAVKDRVRRLNPDAYADVYGPVEA